MGKVLVFYTPIIEVVDFYTRIINEIIINNIEDDIVIVKCTGNKGLKNCISNSNSNFYKCKICKKKLDSLIKISDSKKIEIDYYSTEDFYFPINVSNYDELKCLTYKDINIGRGIHAAAMTILKDHNYNVNENINVINKIAFTSKKTIDYLFSYFDKGIKKIYVFNGRVSHYNAIVEFAKLKGIKYFTFEAAGIKNKYFLVEDDIIHNKKKYVDYISSNWIQSGDLKKHKIGKSFFEKNLTRSHSDDYLTPMFTEYQNAGFLPSSIKGKNFIVFFGSSRNESESIEGWKNNFMSGDDEQIVEEICVRMPKINFVYRAHPNLKLEHNTQTQNIKKLQNIKNLTLIDSHSKVSSYELLRKSDKVIVFGSTIGVESNYFRKPTICLGPSIYENLNIAYKPKNFEELKCLIQDPNLKPLSYLDSIKYGYFELTKGKSLSSNSLGISLELNLLDRVTIFISKFFKLSLMVFNKKYRLKDLINDPRIKRQLLDFLKV